MTETFTVVFENKRCWKCGVFWAIETTRNNISNECPRCARESIRQLQSDVDSLARTISGLRGAVSRLKRKNETSN